MQLKADENISRCMWVCVCVCVRMFMCVCVCMCMCMCTHTHAHTVSRQIIDAELYYVYIIKREKPQHFRFLASEWPNSRKKAKKKFRIFWPKKILSPPAGVTPNGQKSKKIFFHFWHQNDSIREKKQKKDFDPKFGPGMCGMWPFRGSRWVFG